MVKILNKISIPDDELTFSFSRSSKPGGQNVNKISSRVTLLFDVAESSGLTDHQRKVISKKLSTRISKEGILRIACQKYRSQKLNRTEAVARFTELLKNALSQKPPRKKTKIPGKAVKKRLETKKHKGRLKQERTKKILVDE